VFVGIVLAGDAPTLPSQKAEVVLPLLREFSPRDISKQSALKKITKILGNDCLKNIHGPNGAVEELFYDLDDDKGIIHVTFVKDKLATITRDESARVLEVLYSTSNH